MHPRYDLTGQTFGRLKVIDFAGRDSHGLLLWNCLCECGNTKIVTGSHLRYGEVLSCGCLAKEQRSINGKNSREDHLGKVYGRLTVINIVESKSNKTMLLCKCICGNETIVDQSNLKQKRVISCGCYHIERLKELSGKNSVHWRGGRSFEPYCYKFNKQKREEIRERHSRRCFLCGRTEEANGRKLDVHHVNYDKNQGCESNWDLIPLCKKCHAKTNSKRYLWKFIIRYKLKEFEYLSMKLTQNIY